MTRIAFLLAAEALGEEWPAIAGQVDHLIEMAASALVGMDQQAVFLSDPEVFDPRMTPTDYELHCAAASLRRMGCADDGGQRGSGHGRHRPSMWDHAGPAVQALQPVGGQLGGAGDLSSTAAPEG